MKQSALKENTKALQRFLTDEQILEVMLLFENRKMEACRLLREYLFDKWQITMIQAVCILQNIQKEL